MSYNIRPGSLGISPGLRGRASATRGRVGDERAGLGRCASVSFVSEASRWRRGTYLGRVLLKSSGASEVWNNCRGGLTKGAGTVAKPQSAPHVLPGTAGVAQTKVAPTTVFFPRRLSRSTARGPSHCGRRRVVASSRKGAAPRENKNIYIYIYMCIYISLSINKTNIYIYI